MTARTMERHARRSAAQGETFILLGSDGRHVLLGRQCEPDAAEVGQIAALLAAKNLGGWVALMRGDYWHRQRRVSLERIREAAPSSIPFDQAEAAFQAIRRGALAP
ncbi:hypothetical protein [Roseomonas chloroacetimidivorans]|uniref:hypothetical protein n=1 Tax=Roseomonas chloroacetimidivorans TaxID=1766656 RepID=UPI003C70B416